MAVSVLYATVLNNESSKTGWHSAASKGGKVGGAVSKKILARDLGRFDITGDLVGETENGKLLLHR